MGKDDPLTARREKIPVARSNDDSSIAGLFAQRDPQAVDSCVISGYIASILRSKSSLGHIDALLCQQGDVQTIQFGL